MFTEGYHLSTRSATPSSLAARCGALGVHRNTSNAHARASRGRGPHRALQVYDILYLIIENVISTDQDGAQLADARLTLAKAARVCKAFLEPALDMLWRVLDGLLPLLGLLYQDPSTASAYDSIAQHRWLRFHFYACRIHEMHYDDTSPTYQINSTVLHALSHQNNEQPLLPSLRVLIWKAGHTNQSESLMAVSMILNRYLPEVHVRISPTETRSSHSRVPYLDDLLSRLRVQLVGLGHVRIYGPPDSSSLATVADWERLRTLHLDCGSRVLRASTLCYLAQASQLSDLSLNIQVDMEAEFRLVDFPQLHTLSFITAHRGIPRVLAAINAPNLSSLNLKRLIFDTEEDLRDSVHLIGTRFCRKLRHIRLAIGIRDRSKTSYPLIGIVRPLLSMRQLRTFSLQTNIHLALSNTELCTMAIAWPDITELSVYGLGSPTVNPSIDALAHLAGQCPRLTKLMLPLLARPSYINAAPGRMLRHGLKTIDTAESMYGWHEVDIERCAQLLYSYFPNLDVKLIASDVERFRPDHFRSSNWRRIMEMYVAMRPLRAYSREEPW